MQNQVTIRKFFDGHVHLRQDAMLLAVAPYTAQVCSHAIVMPNTIPPIRAPEDVVRYKRACREATEHGDCDFLLAAKLMPDHTPDDISRLADAGVIGLKLYPEGVTTHSGDGIPADWLLIPPPQLVANLKRMAELGLVLLQHGEMPLTFCLDRETKYLEFFSQIAHEIPTLKMTLEHITTEASVDLIGQLVAQGRTGIAATITLHHLMTNLDDVIGDMLRPDHFCKPVPKRPQDQNRLRQAAFSGRPSFFLGSDSAPHLRSSKYAECGCAGVFTAPVLLPALVQEFERHAGPQWSAKLTQFATLNALKFYEQDKITDESNTITLVRQPFEVPASIAVSGLRYGDSVTPFLARQTLDWSIHSAKGKLDAATH